jgi:hypothetical protein
MTEVPGSEPTIEHIPEPVLEPLGAPMTPPNMEPKGGASAETAGGTAGAAPRPTDVVVVTVLALLAGLGDVIAGVAWLIEKDSISGPAAYLAWAVLLIGLGTAALAAMLFIGSRIARTLIALFMILRIVAHVWVWISVGSDAAVVAMIEILIATVVLIMLYSRESTAFLTGAKK